MKLNKPQDKRQALIELRAYIEKLKETNTRLWERATSAERQLSVETSENLALHEKLTKTTGRAELLRKALVEMVECFGKGASSLRLEQRMTLAEARQALADTENGNG